MNGHPQIPLLCPSLLASPLLQCWTLDPKCRPRFDFLLRCIEDLENFKADLQGTACCQDNHAILQETSTSNSIGQILYTEVNSPSFNDITNSKDEADEETKLP